MIAKVVPKNKPLLERIGAGPHSSMRTLGRIILLAGLVGMLAGLGAIAFHGLCLGVMAFGLEWLAGYDQGRPTHETVLPFGLGRLERSSLELIPWMLVLLPAVGGLISGQLVYRLAPEAAGPGTDSAIRAYHHNRGRIGLRVSLVKILASAVTLGTGGSGGREGPIAQIGAGLGSWVATRLRLSDNERRTLMAAGLGAGIGAIFHAPLAGAIFAIEVLYRDPDFESEALIPAFIATTVSYSIFSSAFGLSAFEPLFQLDTQSLSFTKPLLLLPPLTALAIAMAVASFFYVTTLRSCQSAFGRLRLPDTLKPAIGGLLTGTVALVLYHSVRGLGTAAQHDVLAVLSFGYGFLQDVLNPQGAAVAVSLLLIVAGGKILTTSLTIGSGGAGGVFGPSMVIGGSLGAVVGVLFHRWVPELVGPNDLVLFAILGMAGFFAAAANTPVSTLIMVSELTNSYALLLPSMWVCALAYLCSQGWTLYRQQVSSRLESPAHRGDFIVDILQGLNVREALTEAHRRFVSVPLGMPVMELSRLITSNLQSSFPVLDRDGDYYGLFSLNDIRQFLYDADLGPLAVAQDLATANVEPLTLRMDLSDAISRFAQGRFDELPVVEESAPKTIVAMLRRQDVIAVYNRRLLEARAGRQE